MEKGVNDSHIKRFLVDWIEIFKGIIFDIMQIAIEAEIFIDDIISWHFCPEKDQRDLFFSMVLSGQGLTFSSKIEIFQNIMKLKYEDLEKEYPDVIKILNELRELRNRIAHSRFDDLDEDWIIKHPDRFRLIYFKNGRKKEKIVTYDEFKKRLEIGKG